MDILGGRVKWSCVGSQWSGSLRIAPRASPSRIPGHPCPRPSPTSSRRQKPNGFRCTVEDSAKSEEAKEAEQDALKEKLARAEAEAQALRKELASRKSKIDGIGYRETIFKGPETAGRLAKKDGKGSWGFTEAELLLSRGAPSEGAFAELQAEAQEGTLSKQEQSAIVQRRLLVALGLAAAAVALSLIDIPVTLDKPSKPINIYVVPLLTLQEALTTVEEQGELLDALGLRAQLKLALGSKEAVKENLLSVTALLDGAARSSGKALSFEILSYLDQADYSNYFEGMGVPGAYQQAEYIKFSLQSVQVAKQKLAEFLALVPAEALEKAKVQLGATAAA